MSPCTEDRGTVVNEVKGKTLASKADFGQNGFEAQYNK